MFWRPALSVASGAVVTVGSTFVACSLATEVEKSANRVLYWCAPEKYAYVEYAYGLTEDQLRKARLLATRHSLRLPISQLASSLASSE